MTATAPTISPTAVITATTVTGGGARATVRSRRHHLLAGGRAMAPWLLGVVPFGLVIGISAARADIPTSAGWLTGPLLYAGSAQVATIQLLDGGAGPAVVVVAALAINLRLVLYSATMARHWHGTSRWWQALGAYLLVDPSLAVGVDGYERNPDRAAGHLHYLGGAVVLWVAWLAAITVGATLGAGLPAGLHLELVIPLFLVGEVVPRLGRRVTNRAVAVAAVVAAAGLAAPFHLGPVLAMAAGVAVALKMGEDDR
jgi:predicted branched-subunit amino acid permease